jgi:hypothetical protein
MHVIPVEKPNPFKVLGLPVDAGNKTIVEKGRELRQFAESEEMSQQYRIAIESLITHPMTRLEYELFELPGTRYEDPEWERFARLFRRNPVSIDSLAGEAPPASIEDFNMEAIIGLLLDGMLAVDMAGVETAVEHLPYEAGNGSPPLGVRDVIFG